MERARCSKCKRPLTNPAHAAANLGPICAAKMGLEFKRPEKARRPRKPRSKRAHRAQTVDAPMLPFETVDTPGGEA